MNLNEWQLADTITTELLIIVLLKLSDIIWNTNFNEERR